MRFIVSQERMQVGLHWLKRYMHNIFQMFVFSSSFVFSPDLNEASTNVYLSQLYFTYISINKVDILL